MAYATVDELAAKLRIAVTPGNTAALQSCLDAAAVEIDASVDLRDPVAGIGPAGLALANQANILRAVEWWKSNDAAWNVLADTSGAGMRLPKNTFARHSVTLRPLKEQFGIG
jgi:hypothetical protein